MKKKLLVLLAALLIFTLTGCGEKGDDYQPDTTGYKSITETVEDGEAIYVKGTIREIDESLYTIEFADEAGFIYRASTFEDLNLAEGFDAIRVGDEAYFFGSIAGLNPGDDKYYMSLLKIDKNGTVIYMTYDGMILEELYL